MQGVVFTGEKGLELMTFPDPTPGPGEVVIEMKASGMCGSDLHQYRRPKNQPRNATGLPPNPNPTIAGHEPCGIVAAIGPDVLPAEAKIGQRVMVQPQRPRIQTVLGHVNLLRRCRIDAPIEPQHSTRIVSLQPLSLQRRNQHNRLPLTLRAPAAEKNQQRNRSLN